MIDRNTGAVFLGKHHECFSSCYTLNEFKLSPYFKKAEILVDNQEYISYRLQDIGLTSRLKCTLVLQFQREKLYELHICVYTPNSSKRWADWSTQDEIKRKKIHDEYLLQEVGPPPYTFDWGGIISVYDKKGGASEIIIKWASLES